MRRGGSSQHRAWNASLLRDLLLASCRASRLTAMDKCGNHHPIIPFLEPQPLNSSRGKLTTQLLVNQGAVKETSVRQRGEARSTGHEIPSMTRSYF